MKKFLSILLCLCLLATTVFTMPMASAEETEVKEYFYHFNDYESLTNDAEWLSLAKQGTSMSVESGANVISGAQSLKTTMSGNGYAGFAFTDVKLGQNIKTRVSFDYKVTVGTKDWSGVGYIGFTKAVNSAGVEGVNCYNWATVNGENYSNKVTNSIGAVIPAPSTIRTFKDTITRKDSGSTYPIGIFMHDQKAAAEVVFDNLTVAEIIETVAAVSENEAKGTVTVANKETKYTDYAMKETAVFTATAAEGYTFAGWYNGDVLVSTDAVYEHILLGDTTLTAKWKVLEKEYQYASVDYEDLTAYNTELWLSKAQNSTASIETENPISGNASLKLTANKTGYGGMAILPEEITLKAGKNYRVKVETKVLNGTFQLANVGNIGNANATSYNWSHIGTNATYTGYPNDNGGTPLVVWTAWVSKTSAHGKISKQGTIKVSENTQYKYLGFATHAKELDAETSDASILIDNVVAAEIIDTVSVANSDETKGTVSVANKDGFEDYAKGEVAVFTATAAEGYSFAGWYNAEDVLVSTEAVYEHTLTTDTTLTAKWKLYEKEYDYKAYDYENMTDTDAWFATARENTMSFETETPINGSASLKLTANKKGYIGAAIIPNDVSLKSATNYRVTASAKVTAGVFNFGRIGSATISDGTVNHWNIGTGAAPLSNGCVPFVILNDNWTPYSNTMPVRTVTSVMTTATKGAPVLGSIFSVSSVDENSTASILIDDFVAAEIIDSVTATSLDTTMGTATVVNKAGFEDYAKNEVAVFTATANKGYYFVGWYNAADELVSTEKNYELTLYTDAKLTAKFAAYDKLVNVSFNTNGGNEIEAVSDGEGADLVMPENPVKDGYVFAGWYADADFTTPFTANVFPAEDITVYAKWASAYQDFENYTAITNGNFTIMNDGENAYLGNGYMKYAPTGKDASQSRMVVSGDVAIKDIATPGDQVELSFKYKLVSGDARFYVHTSTLGDRVALKKSQTLDGGEVWINGYQYKNVNLAAPSEEWQTLTTTLNVKKLSEVIAEGFTVEDFLYTVFIFASENGAELYIDEITLDVIPEEKVKTAYNNAAALRSATASSTGKNGLRVYNEVDSYWLENNTIVEYGSVAAFASNIEDEITLENGIKGIAYSDGTLSAEKYSVWEVTADGVVFTSYLTNIGSARYGEDILIRSYAIDANGNVYYGKTASVSVFEVANAMDNANTADGSEQSETDIAAFYSFVTSANSAQYQAWCNDNGKNIGALFNGKYAN